MIDYIKVSEPFILPIMTINKIIYFVGMID